MHAQGDAAKHRERTDAKEHAKLVVQNANAYHLALMAIREHALVMPN